MATIRVHEDQENRIPNILRKQMDPVPQKRTVLGALDNQQNVSRVALKPNQNPTLAKRNDDENACCDKEYVQKMVPPVAQFEAFKVYEDEDYNVNQALRTRKLKKNDPSNYYKGTEEDKFVTKRELIAMGKLKIEYKSLEVVEPEIPMSIEKIPHESETRLSRNALSELEEFHEYQMDIFQYLREHELFNRPKAGYMKKQPDITHSMRSILVDWLVEVSEEYELHTETLYLAVNFIDRFLSYMSVVRGKLQLVGTAAMFTAAKYEEIYPPDVSQFVYITADTFSRKQVIRMEQLILKVLAFDLSIPTPWTFITVICSTNKIPEKTMFLAMYLCELGLLEAEPYLELLPSNLAAAAIAIARHTLGEPAWSPQLAKNTGYELRQLCKSVQFLEMMFEKAPELQQQAIQDKYKKDKFLNVGELVPAEVGVRFE